jgi:quinol monooxygenase YgiN
MSQPVAIVATIVAAPGQRTHVEQALVEAVDAVRLEPGCEQYDLHRDLTNADRFVMIERWRDADAVAAHGAGPALAKLGKALNGNATLDILKLEHVH